MSVNNDGDMDPGSDAAQGLKRKRCSGPLCVKSNGNGHLNSNDTQSFHKCTKYRQYMTVATDVGVIERRIRVWRMTNDITPISILQS